MIELTNRQKQLFDIIKKYQEKNEEAPTYSYMARKMNCSMAGVTTHINALERKKRLIKNRLFTLYEN